MLYRANYRTGDATKATKGHEGENWKVSKSPKTLPHKPSSVEKKRRDNWWSEFSRSYSFFQMKVKKVACAQKPYPVWESGRDIDVCDAKAQKKPNSKERKKDKGKNKKQTRKRVPSVLNLARKSI